MTTKKKQKIIEDYILNNREAFYRIAYSYTKNKEDALDIIQESIYKALKSVDGLKEIAYVKTWFYNILTHTAIDCLRKNKKYVLEDIENPFPEQGKCDNYEDIDIKNMLDCLPSKQRTIIVLRYFEDLKLKEISEILNENLSTIKNHLYKGLKTLKLEITAQEVKDYE